MPDETEPSDEQVRRALRIVQAGMMKQARARGWCGEYEMFVKDINEACGFQALSERLRRLELQATVQIRVRCGTNDQVRIIDELIDYMQGFTSDIAIECEVQLVTPQVLRTDEEHMNEPETIETLTDSMLPGYQADACNCEQCREDRVRRQRMADQPVPARRMPRQPAQPRFGPEDLG